MGQLAHDLVPIMPELKHRNSTSTSCIRKNCDTPNGLSRSGISSSAVSATDANNLWFDHYGYADFLDFPNGQFKFLCETYFSLSDGGSIRIHRQRWVPSRGFRDPGSSDLGSRLSHVSQT